METLKTLDDLREGYQEPGIRARNKNLTYLDKHCRHFVALSPFVILSSCDNQGRMDASPRGGKPGFVHCPDPHTLLLPDWPGNNLLDSLSNLVENPRIGLLFLLPGVDETLRVNGSTELSKDEELCRSCMEGESVAKLIIRIHVEEAYLHCAKALMRAKLWADESRIDRSLMPTMGQMLKDQLQSDEPAESQDSMVERYGKSLY